MGVELSINEVDVTTLAEGQDAEIEFDAVADLKMTGTVDEVATAGTIESGVVSYRVWLTLDGTDERLKTGMSAAATIVTAWSATCCSFRTRRSRPPLTAPPTSRCSKAELPRLQDVTGDDRHLERHADRRS